MARNEQLIRQHKILQLLERYRFGRLLSEIRDELVAELGLTSLHTRSVRRDLDALQAAGIDIRFEEIDRGKVWKLGPTVQNTHKISATATELIALSLGRDLMYPLAGTPFWQGIEGFWNKIQDELPDAVWQHYEKYRRTMYVLGMPAKSYGAQQGVLKTINRAIVEHRVVEIEYQPIGKASSLRSIEPYAIVFYQSSLYIIAAAHEIPEDQARVRHWKLDRFKKATALDAWFKLPPDFDLQEHLGQSMGIFAGAAADTNDFRIRIRAKAIPWVTEDPWHPEQKTEPVEDGTGDIILSVRAAHELEIIPRVLALGMEAELLSPSSSRQSIARMLSEMAATYDDSPS